MLPLHGGPTDMAVRALPKELTILSLSCRSSERLLGWLEQVSLSLARLLAASFPDAYATRKVEETAEAQVGVGDMTVEANSLARSAAHGEGEPETTLPLFYLDPMLPRQRLPLNIFEPRYRLMVRRCLEGSRRFGMLGVEWLTPLRHMGQRSVRHGVEVEIVENAPQADGRFHIEVVAGRRFEIVGATWEQDGYAMATVRWILPPSLQATPFTAVPVATTEATAGPEGEVVPSQASDGSISARAGENRDRAAVATYAAVESDHAAPASDRPSTAQAPVRIIDDATCLEMAATLGTLVEQWKELVSAGRWERFRGQLGRSLADLGPMPAATDMDGVVERSLWVGALINPLPGLGVAMEVRPFLLAAGGNPHEMVQVATEAIVGSIAHMTPSPAALWVRRQLARLDWSSWRENEGDENQSQLVSLGWLWRFFTVAGAGGLLTLVLGTFVLVCLGIHRAIWYMLEAQQVTDAAAGGEPVDLTRYTTRSPPPAPPPLPSPPFVARDEV